MFIIYCFLDNNVEEERADLVDQVLVNVITGDINTDKEAVPLTSEERNEVTKPMCISVDDADALAKTEKETTRGNDPIHPLGMMLMHYRLLESLFCF